MDSTSNSALTVLLSSVLLSSLISSLISFIVAYFTTKSQEKTKFMEVHNELIKEDIVDITKAFQKLELNLVTTMHNLELIMEKKTGIPIISNIIDDLKNSGCVLDFEIVIVSQYEDLAECYNRIVVKPNLDDHNMSFIKDFYTLNAILSTNFVNTLSYFKVRLFGERGLPTVYSFRMHPSGLLEDSYRRLGIEENKGLLKKISDKDPKKIVENSKVYHDYQSELIKIWNLWYRRMNKEYKDLI